MSCLLLQDFFSYDSGSGFVSPCSEQTSGMLVCSQLTDLVSSAAEFCKAAGEQRALQLAVAAVTLSCFSGRHLLQLVGQGTGQWMRDYISNGTSLAAQ